MKNHFFPKHISNFLHFFSFHSGENFRIPSPLKSIVRIIALSNQFDWLKFLEAVLPESHLVWGLVILLLLNLNDQAYIA